MKAYRWLISLGIGGLALSLFAGLAAIWTDGDLSGHLGGSAGLLGFASVVSLFIGTMMYVDVQ